MDPLFDNDLVEELIKDLADVTKDKKKINKYLSADVVRTLKRKYDGLIAAPNFAMFIKNPIGHFEALKENMKGKYSIRITGNYRLIIRPNSEDLTLEALEACTEFYFEGVVDYHDRRKYNWLIP
jgi:plasmid maintenance system killer protein